MSTRSRAAAPAFHRHAGPRWHSAWVLLAWLSVLIVAFPARAQGLDALLAYDAALPLNLHVRGREQRHGVLVEDVTYRSASGDASIAAYVVRPAWVNGPYAGIVFGHWFEPSAANSNRTEFLDEAVALARRGVLSVLPATPWSDPAWFDARSWRDDFRSTVEQARDFRRAVDVLLAQVSVDPQRIAFVGHDFSAMHGALISAVENRVKAYVLIAGTARWADWYLYGAADGVPTGAELATYLAQLGRIDPVVAVAKTRGHVTFQFGENDFYTPRANFTGLYGAAPLKTSRLLTYEATHPMDATLIRVDRDAWLGEQLGLTAGRPFDADGPR